MPFLKKAFHKAYQKLETKEHELLYLFLELTRRCNLNCLHCGSDCKSEFGLPELTTDSWLKIIDYMCHNFSPQLAFVITGGEPLLHPDLKVIGQHITNRGRRWGMVTNGMALNNQRMRSLTDAGLYSITLSLDGTETAHNRLRNHPSAYQRTLAALDLIAESEVSIRDVVTCVYPANLNELEAIASVLLEKRIPAWRLFRIFPSGRAKNNEELLLSFEQTHHMLDWIAANRKKYADLGLKINYSCEGYLPFEQDIQIRDEAFFCRAGINIASILSNGNITGCTNNHHYFYEGNILKNDFRYLWENGFQKFRGRGWAKTGICKDCPEFKYCQGSSIHLWGVPEDGIAFCYVQDKG